MREISFRCFFCGKAFSEKDLHDRGFIKTRKESAGGPFFIYKCTHCGEEMKCAREREQWEVSPYGEGGPFEFFWRILEGYLPFWGPEEKARPAARASAGRAGPRDRKSSGGPSWRGGPRKEKAKERPPSPEEKRILSSRFTM